MELPVFKYHPDPLATGSVVPSVEVCPVCKESRGFAYDGIPYGTKDLEHACPWCIADGSAHEKFGVEFTAADEVGGHGKWEIVPKEVVEEIAFRTPGFASWQQEHWFTHCGDGAEFLGPMGKEELKQIGPEAIQVIREESGQQGADWESYFSKLDRKFTAQPISSGAATVGNWAAIPTAFEDCLQHRQCLISRIIGQVRTGTHFTGYCVNQDLRITSGLPVIRELARISLLFMCLIE